MAKSLNDTGLMMTLGILVVICVLAIYAIPEPSPKKYKINSGQICECASYYETYCGIKLRQCKDGIDRDCLNNVEKLP